jgi:hypothetical protein
VLCCAAEERDALQRQLANLEKLILRGGGATPVQRRNSWSEDFTPGAMAALRGRAANRAGAPQRGKAGSACRCGTLQSRHKAKGLGELQ